MDAQAAKVGSLAEELSSGAHMASACALQQFASTRDRVCVSECVSLGINQHVHHVQENDGQSSSRASMQAKHCIEAFVCLQWAEGAFGLYRSASSIPRLLCVDATCSAWVRQCILHHNDFQQAAQSVILKCPGALTNAALLLTLFPEAAEEIEQIVLMGGAIGPGNTNPSAEFNMQASLLTPYCANPYSLLSMLRFLY